MCRSVMCIAMFPAPPVLSSSQHGGTRYPPSPKEAFHECSFLSSRAIIGEFSWLDQDLAGTWIPGVSREFTSDQESETYKWLGMSPAMREWTGGRQPRGMRASGITIPNKSTSPPSK